MSVAQEEKLVASISKDEKRLAVLEARKETLFTRLQRIYDVSRDVSSEKKLAHFKIRCQTLEQTKEEFSNILDSINELQLTIDPNAIPDFAALNSFDEVYCHIRAVADQVLKTDPSSRERPENSSKRTPKLPELTLPIFSGDFKEWPIFYECFKSLVHDNPDLTDVDRINFLISKLSGPARNVCQGLPPIGSNYSIIWNALIEKYQDKRKLANSYLDIIFEFKTLVSESAAALNHFIDNFHSSIAALRKLGIVDLLDYILAYIALSKLDSTSRKSFETTRKSLTLPTYTEIIDFVKLQAQALGSLGSKNFSSSKSSSSNQSKQKTVQSFVVSNTSDNLKKCPACLRLLDHSLFRCPKFLTLTPNERYVMVRSNHYCLNCLASHKIINCKSKTNCNKCNGRHHTLLHFQKSSSVTSGNNSLLNSGPNTSGNMDSPVVDNVTSLCSTSSTLVSNTTVLLSTVVVDVVDSEGRVNQLRLLVDSASQANFITMKCCRKFKFQVQNYHLSVCGLGNISSSVQGRTSIVISSTVDPLIKYSIDLLVIDKISNKLPNVEINLHSLQFLENLPLADKTFHTPGDIDGILGAEIYAIIAGSKKVMGPLGFPTVLETSLGYIVLGKVPTEQSSEDTQALCSFVECSLETLFQRFWELEEIYTPIINPDDEKCETIFKATTTRHSDGRYTVALPFKKDASHLGDSYSTAHRRFLSLEKN